MTLPGGPGGDSFFAKVSRITFAKGTSNSNYFQQYGLTAYYTSYTGILGKPPFRCLYRLPYWMPL